MCAKLYLLIILCWVQAKAADLKAKGNAAFSAQRYRDAIDLFSQCIELDPK